MWVKGEKIRYEIEAGRFKLWVGKDLLFNIRMDAEVLGFLNFDTKVKCLYEIFKEHPELLMIFLLQLESEGKL